MNDNNTTRSNQIRDPKTGRTKFISMPMWGDTKFERFFCPSSVKCDVDYPAVDSYVDGTVFLVYADFDKLPDGYSDWDAFEEYCRWQHGHGFVFRTRSNKVKIVFRVNERPTKTTANATLKSILGDDFRHIDTNEKAMLETFMHPRWFGSFGAFCFGEGHVYPVVHDYQWEMIDVKDKKFDHPIVDSLPAIEKKVYRFMASTNRCVKGLDCPQKFIAEQIGCDQSEVSRALASMAKKGLIECIDASVKIGKKAKTFVLSGVLLSLFVCFSPRDPRTLYGNHTPLPTAIEDGTFYFNLWAATNWFTDGGSYFKWVHSIPNIGKKDRLDMAERAWATHAARNGLC